MFLATLVLTCCALQSSGSAGPSGPAHAPPPSTPWQRVETLRALLDQKLRDQAPVIGPKLMTLDRSGPGGRGGATDTTKNDTEPATETGAPEDNPSLVAERFRYATVTDAFLMGQSSFAVRSHGEFVPGMGAVVSVTVPVRCDVVPPAPGKPTEKPAPKKSDDDAEWDAIANGKQRPTADGMWRTLTKGSPDPGQPKLTFTVSPEALAALKKCALDTAWRFGAKLELSRGERLAIVVVAEPTPSGEQRFSGWLPNAVSYPSGADGSVDPATSYMSLSRASLPALPPAKRLVILVSSEELKSYRAGDVDPGELESVASGDF